MEKNYFLAKLIPPRPSFTADMNAEERQVMMDHGAYLRKYVEVGTVIVMGPVLDPAGPWGLAVFETGSEDEVRTIIARDPYRPLRARFPVGDLPDAAGGCPGLVPGTTPRLSHPRWNSPSEKTPQKRVRVAEDRPLRLTPGLANGARITDFIRAIFSGIQK